MYTIRHPHKIIFGTNSCSNFDFPSNSLVITSKGAKSRGWLDYMKIKNYEIFDHVESNPSMETAEIILSEFNSDFSVVIGIGGGSSLDVAKYVGYKLKKPKILIPTTFGSGTEVTRISVLKINGKKTSFHNDELLADIAIVDPFFIKSSSENIIKNSAIDACAQCSEAFDSKSGNVYTKFLCKKAFDFLEDGILNKNNEKLVIGSLIAGLGFGNCSTTLGHALSYVFSNEGFPHGHALAYTTTLAHKFNKSIFYNRFLQLIKELKFAPISLEADLDEAADLILADSKHLENNPKPVTKKDIISLLEQINQETLFN